MEQNKLFFDIFFDFLNKIEIKFVFIFYWKLCLNLHNHPRRASVQV